MSPMRKLHPPRLPKLTSAIRRAEAELKTARDRLGVIEADAYLAGRPADGDRLTAQVVKLDVMLGELRRRAGLEAPGAERERLAEAEVAVQRSASRIAGLEARLGRMTDPDRIDWAPQGVHWVGTSAPPSVSVTADGRTILSTAND